MATNTSNYAFKKPDESEYYNIQDQNGNWEKADQSMHNVEYPEFEDYTGSTSVPSASAALGNIKTRSKIGILMSNIKAFCKGCCTLAMIVNNCVTNNANLPLSAAQGKVLMDLFTKLNSDLSNSVKFEYKSITDSGKIWNCYVITLGGIRIVSAKTWLSGISCPTQWGGMYSSAEIAGLPYPITFNASPVVNATFNSISNHGFVMSISDGATTKSPAFKLLRGTSGTISGTLCVTAIGDIAS